MKSLIKSVKVHKSVFWCGFFYGIGFYPSLPDSLVPRPPHTQYRGSEADVQNLHADWNAMHGDFSKAFNKLSNEFKA